VKLCIESATPQELTESVSWQYDPPYDFYDDDGKPIKNPERFFVARDEDGDVVGFFYFVPFVDMELVL
jgi:hypothetical protein